VLGMKCWRCGRTDGEVFAYAYVEEPERDVFDAHAECLVRMGIGGELVKVEKSRRH